MKEWFLNTTELKSAISKINAGDRVILSGTVYTARDAAHKLITNALANSEELPFNLDGAAIYYAGPTPTPKNLAIGSCGPTTSSRMDKYAPSLLDSGLKCMIGKGDRSKDVYDAIVRNEAIYLCAIGGAGALAAKHITKCKEIAFSELGCESVKVLNFDNFPLICAIDSKGNSIFK
ncbi:MAG: fumarate hydratase C-terminal domain-containing protein [Clostridia bacterium]|nr:fumarate hydratase C-terminal domain-containing protein [Clostridia bacterium]